MTGDEPLTPAEVQRGVLSVFYEGPWERAMNWVYGINPRTNELRWEITSDRNPLAWLAQRLEDRHRVWLDRYVAAGVNPPARWARRVREF